MAKQIVINYQDKKYVLEFNRNAVQTMERNGFVLEEIETKPMTMILALFTGAFIQHHSSVKRTTVEAIYDFLPQKRRLLETLVEMYHETLTSLMDASDVEDDGDDSKNEAWAAQ